MLAAVSGSWIGAAGGLAAFIIAVSPLLWRGFRSSRDDRALITGRRKAPGLPPVPPLGERIGTLEELGAKHTEILDEHGGMLQTIVDELKPNSGRSFRDHVERAAAQAQAAAREAAGAG